MIFRCTGFPLDSIFQDMHYNCLNLFRRGTLIFSSTYITHKQVNEKFQNCVTCILMSDRVIRMHWTHNLYNERDNILSFIQPWACSSWTKLAIETVSSRKKASFLVINLVELFFFIPNVFIFLLQSWHAWITTVTQLLSTANALSAKKSGSPVNQGFQWQ